MTENKIDYFERWAITVMFLILTLLWASVAVCRSRDLRQNLTRVEEKLLQEQKKSLHLQALVDSFLDLNQEGER